MKLMEAVGITKIYERGNTENTTVRALDAASISIEKNEIVAIMGPSGSGKSTLLRVLGALESPDEGHVYIEGTNITEKSDSHEMRISDDVLSRYRREKIGFVFQDYNLISILTLKENVELPIRLSGRKVDKAHIERLLDIFDINDCAGQFPHKVSGGQQQRAAIARAVANNPSIILADEPTGSLDRKNSQVVMDFLKKSVALYDQTVIVVTHDSFVSSYADRIVEIVDGRII